MNWRDQLPIVAIFVDTYLPSGFKTYHGILSWLVEWSSLFWHFWCECGMVLFLCNFEIFCLFVCMFWDRVYLCRPSCPETHSVGQTGQNSGIYLFCFQSVGIKGKHLPQFLFDLVWFLKDRVSLCRTGYTRTQSVVQSGLKVRDLPASILSAYIKGMHSPIFLMLPNYFLTCQGVVLLWSCLFKINSL